MNRKIKFRFWNKNDKTMSKVKSLFIDYHALVLHGGKNGEHSAKMIDGVLMQYTGLKDKNGKEIYEGDILHIDRIGDYPRQQKHTVIWNDDFATFGTDVDSCFDWVRYERKIEVIGNKHEGIPVDKKAEILTVKREGWTYYLHKDNVDAFRKLEENGEI